MFRCILTNDHIDAVPGVKFELFDAVNDIPLDQWSQVLKENQLLMSVPYLRTIENTAADEEVYRYVLIYKNEELVGAAVFTLFYLYGRDYVLTSRYDVCPVVKLKVGIKDKAKLRVLMCGHTHVSGDHGFVYRSESKEREGYQVLAYLMSLIREKEKNHRKVDLQLIKDVSLINKEASENLFSYKYCQFQVDPNMEVRMDKDWNTFDDYLDAMKTKYRKMAKMVLKSGENVIRKSLDSNQMEQASKKMQQLYQNVLNKAKFKMNHFDIHYLIELKKQLGDKFEVIGYYEGVELIGFSSRIVGETNCEAHIIGMDYTKNHQFSLYLNILYDHVKRSIELKSLKLILGRTAMEMKSNIGAVPVELWCYVRHSRPHLNHLIKPVMKFIQPSEWIQRNPFKKISMQNN